MQRAPGGAGPQRWLYLRTERRPRASVTSARRSTARTGSGQGETAAPASFGSSSPVGSLSSEDHDFDPSAEMLVHDYDDERTLEEEEMMEESKNFSSEIEDLEKEGNMPLEDLLAFYGYEPTIPVMAGSSADSSPSELADELPDMTLDKASVGSSSPVGSLSSEDHDFDPSTEMLVHDYDDERTLEEEEEMMEESKNFSSEIEDLEKEGNMPLEDLLAFYGYDPAIPVMASSSADSSPSELADELPDMTLDKEEIAKDLLSGDDEETQSSADDLTPSVTSHEATDFFPRPLRSNTTCDGDKESDGEDVEADNGNSSEDLRKEIMVGSQYQAEIPPYLGRCSDDEKAYENEDHLLWKPDVISESKVKEYLFETSLRTGNEKTIGRIPEGLHTRDNEQALYELLKSSHNVKEAIERYCSNGKASQEMTAWTEEECRSFEHALLIYGKDFHLIQKNKVRTRTVAECVAFYYMWKKSERYDYFAQQTRFGKKRYNHHPGVTDYMDRLVDEAEALGGAVHSSALTSNSRTETIPDQQLSILNSITANELTALTNSVATVCHTSDVNCLDDTFPPMDSLPRAPVNHVPVGTEELLNLPSNGESDCFNLFETGFYHSELNPMNMCSEETERPAKRLKMGIAVPESFMSDVNNLGVDFENHTHHITSAKMAVSVADFSSLSANETNGFINTHTLHQHAALHSE
ncbi:mesoderm induction early response protein 3 isoform B [Patagioenas fasciata monilis]|uniref:Mesoderm induction early response protein 3 isoform B n=1 Tax=Patagioenas fasciata monilis TaxID=372326 RepID=A0A1V4KTD1_PATFA|nr:mesoderm induction early response protein 3 isoform B [Patagioenas fasciata monilis]